MKKVLLKRDFSWDEDGTTKTIGSGTVVTGQTAEKALSDGAGEEIPENQPNFNPLPGQGVAAAPFNVNGQPTDPVADQYVGQGTADETTGTTETGTAPAEGSPVATGSLNQESSGLTDEQLRDRKTALEQQLNNPSTTDEQKKSIQQRLDALKSSKAAPANKAHAAPANKGSK